MSEPQEPTPSLTWEEEESREGNTYEVGRVAEEITAKEEASAAAGDNKELFGMFEGKTPFDIKVNWPCSLYKYSKMESAPQDILDKTGIASFNFSESAVSIPYSFCLEFTNTKNYRYVFYDNSGDGYKVNCFITGNHTVRFNSSKGEDVTIVRITGDK